MIEVRLREEYIKLGQAMKVANLVSSGVEAKFAIQDGEVMMHGRPELQRGKKLYAGDEFEYHGEVVKILGPME